MENKNKDRFRMGGRPTPSDLLLPEEEMKISENPWNFILAIPLAPHHNLYNLSREELARLETLVKGPSNHPLNRSLKGNVAKWSAKTTRKDPLWTSPRPIESVSSSKIPISWEEKVLSGPCPLRERVCVLLDSGRQHYQTAFPLLGWFL